MVNKGIHRRGAESRRLGRLFSAHVEVFDHPEWMDSKQGKSKNEQKRIGVCITSNDGEFFIPGIPKGTYELRVSKDGGFARTHRLIKVDPEAYRFNTEELELTLELGN